MKCGCKTPVAKIKVPFLIIIRHRRSFHARLITMERFMSFYGVISERETVPKYLEKLDGEVVFIKLNN